MDKEVLIKAGKEFLRVIVLAIIPIVVIQVESGVLDYKVVLVTGLIAGLRFIDKYLHELGKSKENESLTKGLTRF